MDWDSEYMQSKLQLNKNMKRNKYKVGQPVRTKNGYYMKIMGLFYDEGLNMWMYYITSRNNRMFEENELFELSEDEKNTYYY